MTKRIPLNNGWDFVPGFTDEYLRGQGSGQPVRLPHSCVETPYDYFDESIYQMHCAYRRTLSVPEEWAGKRLLLTVGAAAHRAVVYLDGQALYEHKCGYTAFTVDLADHVTPGKDHVLAITVDSRETLDQPPFGYVIDYMTYGGLYREVWLEVKEPTCLADVFAQPAFTDRAAGEGAVTSWVSVTAPQPGDTVVQTLLQGATALQRRSFPAQGENTCVLTAAGLKPWGIREPCLYTLRTELYRGGQVLDCREDRIGFREAVFTKDGFFLNGEKVKLRGLNRHQSYPYVGYAMPAGVQQLDADILKNELHCNAVRTSHYPQSPHFIDRCDELGLLVFTEIPGWQHIGGDEWKAQALRNVEDMVRQYRNHPSIILWGVRINESRDDDALYEKTNALCRALDPTRPTGGVRCIKHSHLLEDVYTYNDFVHEGDNRGCEPKKNVTNEADKPYLISEYNGHMFPTKLFDAEAHTTSHALRHARVLNDVAAGGEIAGAFGWCMFDYNTHLDFGSGDRICYHGVMDMYRNPKTAAYVYAIQSEDGTVLTTTSRMDIGEHPTGNMGQVYLLSNADAVRMYKNGHFIREYPTRSKDYPALPHAPVLLTDYVGDALAKNEGYGPTQERLVKDMLNFSAVYGAGHMGLDMKLKAARAMAQFHMTFDDANALYGKYIGSWGDGATTYRFDAVKDGKVVASLTRSPVTAIHLTARVDRTHLTEGDTYDAAAVRITMCDQNGAPLPFFHDAVTLETSGPIALIGPASAMLRGGCGGTYVRTTGQAGDATLTLRSAQGGTVTITFHITKEEQEKQ